jgi:murein L,D-transpeptidase YcbB/YkuD
MTYCKIAGWTCPGLLLVLALGPLGDSGRQARAQSTTSIVEEISGPQRLSSGGEELLKGFLKSAELPDLHWPNFSAYQKEVAELYSSCGGTLPWIQRGKPTGQARVIIRSLESASLQGLRAEDYDGPLWDERLARLERSAATPESDLVRFDLALTVSTMRYISDLHIGRVNPQLFHFGLEIDHRQIDLSEFLRQKLVSASDVNAVLGSVEPVFPIYRRTKDALRKYMQLERRDDGELLAVPARPLTPGDVYEDISQLIKRLTLLGDLQEGKWQSHGKGRYQGALVEAVRHFQVRHGLQSNGILDALTIGKLNTPLSRRVTQIQLAMERMRWLPHQFERPPVVVNIPEFRLYTVDESYRSVFTMNVVVGEAYGHETPVFANEIKSVIFRPYWNVPDSILRAELIPHLEKDSSYFSKNSYEVVDKNDHVVSSGPVSKDLEAELLSGGLSVRQRPGPKNSLGLIKFDFPNPYDVYMHGTPATALFSKTRRDFSHGCIRVEDPVELAKWVLRDMPSWNEDKIRSEMNGKETLQVKLEKPVPVLIFYSTVVVLEDGMVRFFDDLYGYDASLEQALESRAPEDSIAQPKY